MTAPAREADGDANGGFPEPPVDEPVRTVRTTHPSCGGKTRVRLPRSLPPTVVRRVVCNRCAASYEPEVADGPTGKTRAPFAGLRKRLSSPPIPDLPAGAWRLATVPVAIAAVVVGLLLLGGSDDKPRARGGALPPQAAADASFIKRTTYTLALPQGWKTVSSGGGAAFKAVSPDGDADATLWIEDSPKLSFGDFARRSLTHLKDLASNARVFRRSPAPTGGGTIVQLRADVPSGDGTAPYLVTLRASGPYRYYLATSVKPEASKQSRRGAALIHGTFQPEGGKR